jgi:hypothetical protein
MTTLSGMLTGIEGSIKKDKFQVEIPEVRERTGKDRKVQFPLTTGMRRETGQQ